MNEAQATENDALFGNYLEFLSCFRGLVTRTDGSVSVNSDRTEFQMRMPLIVGSPLNLDAFAGNWIALPWIEGIADAYQGCRLSKKGEVVFMSKSVAPEGPASKFRVRACQSAQDLEDFSLVQSRGFLETEDSFLAWHPWLRSANLRNLDNRKCRFLIAELEGKPASVALLVNSPGACGIYAVATPPEFRNRGLSSAIMAACMQMARNDGYERICLQVNAGSYAQTFYEHLGFKENYRIGIWKK